MAAVLYLLFRPVDTVIFKLVELIGVGDIVNELRRSLNPNSFPEWFVYSLPGGLWLLAFQNTLTWLRGFKGKWLIPLVVLASFMGIGLELIQALHITDGRFDWVDVLFYSISTLLALSNIWLVRKRWEIYSSNNTSPKIVAVSFVVFTVLIYLADIV